MSTIHIAETNCKSRYPSSEAITQTEPDRGSKYDTLREFVSRGQAHLSQIGCAGAARLWFTIWSHINGHRGTAFLSALTLAHELTGGDNPDTKSTRRMLRQLIDNGYLIVVEKGNKGRGLASTYRVTVPEKEGTMPLITGSRKGGTVPLFDTEKGAREPLKRGMVPPQQRLTESKYKERAPAPTNPALAEPKPQHQRHTVSGAARGHVEAKPHEGKEPSEHRKAVGYFTGAWNARHGKKYPFEGGRDGKAVKAILETLEGGFEEFEVVVNRYLADSEPFVVRNGHSLGLLRSQLTKYLIDASPPHAAPRGGFLDHGGRTEARQLAQMAAALAPELMESEDRTHNSPRTALVLSSGEECDVPREPPPAPAPTRPEQATIPPELDTPQFRGSWGSWRAEPFNARMTYSTASETLRSLAPLGAVEATRKLDRALARNSRTLEI